MNALVFMLICFCTISLPIIPHIDWLSKNCLFYIYHQSVKNIKNTYLAVEFNTIMCTNWVVISNHWSMTLLYVLMICLLSVEMKLSSIECMDEV